MELSDLGQGYHLVAVREHCRKGRQPPRITQRDWDALDTPRYNYLYAYHGDWDRFIEEVQLALDARLRARVEKSRRYYQRLRDAKRDRALRYCDPMAVQAIAILRAVLTDLNSN